ncbi:MAG: 2OG-Fe(II) oxygenase [Rickettsiales bacterium]|nr:2OG-Fe(II) oxygenase [Rickettsiales bacterium]
MSILWVVVNNMNKISNNPKQRSNALYSKIYWENFFSNQEIEKIISTCSSKEFITATISQEKPVINEETRISKVNFHSKNSENSWIFDRLNFAIEDMNQKFFNFELYGYESFQYSEYYGDNLGKYDFHMDIFMNDESAKLSLTRKLSLVLLLSEPEVDFEGGEFQIKLGAEAKSETITMKKGTLIAFPSFIIHRVKPVLKGTRKSIAIWVEGPKFK